MYLIFTLVIGLKSIYFNIFFEKTIDTFITILVGFLLCWLYWSIAIPIWKNWAYSNVVNINELKTKALKKQLISVEGGFLKKLKLVITNRKIIKNNLKKNFSKTIYIKKIYHFL